MATRLTEARPVTGRVDGRGRLVAADAELEGLQREAGSNLGEPVAIPQLAAIARVARQLRIPVARRALAAGAAQDIDMWVRAVPEGDEVALTIERWESRPPAGPRLATATEGEASPLSGAGHWSVNAELRIVAISETAAELLDVSSSDASGQPLSRLVKIEDDGEDEIPILQALASRSGFERQQVRRRSDGSPLLLNGEVVLDSDGSFAGFEGSIRSAAQPNRPADKTDIVFEDLLNSPIRHIIENAERIAGRSDGPLRDDYAAYAADISAAARHLLSVIRSMGEQGSAARATINLVDLVYEAVGLIETTASEREVAVAIEPLHSFTAHGQAGAVIQILVNLISNAVHHSSLRATVTVSFERSASRSIVHVADDGPGIDLADQQRIFERFERGNGNAPGSGLGLSIARRLAQSMDGDIQLSSAPGKGARFSLVLPAA